MDTWDLFVGVAFSPIKKCGSAKGHVVTGKYFNTFTLIKCLLSRQYRIHGEG